MFSMKSRPQELPLRLPNPQDWCDTAQAVQITGLSRTTLHQMVGDGRLIRHRIGSLPVYWRDQIVEIADAIKLIRRG